MKKTGKKLFALLTLLASLCAAASVQADTSAPDYNRKGSVTMTVTCTDKSPVSGAGLTLYQITQAEVTEEGQNTEVLTADFAEGTFDLSVISEEDPGAPLLARQLADYAADNGISGQKKVSDAQGSVVWEELPLGIYLVVNTEAAKDYETMPPFCITVPRTADDEYVYDVDANPKPVEIKKIPTPTPDPHKDLPQTGQLWWPVPIMLTAGIILVVLGVVLRSRADSV